MELDKKALAVARLATAIFSWDPRGRSQHDDSYKRKQVLSNLLKEALPEAKSRENLVKMVLAMILLTSGHVPTVRNPEGFSDKKQTRWSHIISPRADMLLEILNYPTYELITKQDYINAKQLLPIIGSSSALESEVYSLFSKTGVAKQNPTISQSIEKDPRKKGLGGYDQLYRGLSGMSDASIIRITDLSRPWDLTRGVSTSRNYASAEGFSTKNGPNNVLMSFDNPQRRGFNALKLSKFSTEEEIVLSGVTEIQNYQLTFYAKDIEEDKNAKDYTIEVTPRSIFVRRGLKPFYIEEGIESANAHAFVKIALSGKPFQLKGRDGYMATVKALSGSCSIKTQGIIQ